MNPKIVWITGGGTGIGRAVTERFYREGYRVVISGRRKDVLEQTAQEISKGEIWAIAGDVSDPEYITELHRSVTAKWGDIDILINNAGVNPMHRFVDATPEEFEENFQINCMSAIRCIKAVLPAMLAKRDGTIANVSSILGRWASPNSSAYSVSKYALAGLTDSLRQDLFGSGVHIMGIYPGFIRTAMTLPSVVPGSTRSKMGKSPEAMAQAIYAGIQKKKREVLYPWYVPIAVRLYPWFKGALEKWRSSVER